MACNNNPTGKGVRSMVILLHVIISSLAAFYFPYVFPTLQYLHIILQHFIKNQFLLLGQAQRAHTSKVNANSVCMLRLNICHQPRASAHACQRNFSCGICMCPSATRKHSRSLSFVALDPWPTNALNSPSITAKECYFDKLCGYLSFYMHDYYFPWNIMINVCMKCSVDACTCCSSINTVQCGLCTRA